jgi:hypothetical protein
MLVSRVVVGVSGAQAMLGAIITIPLVMVMTHGPACIPLHRWLHALGVMCQRVV